jgi:predicted DNA-binding protein
VYLLAKKEDKNMQPKLQPKKDRLNVQISSELKVKLSQLSAFQGKKVSALVRESIEEKLDEIEKKIFEDKMKSAYQALAQENLRISEDFKYVDSENL